MSGALWDVEKEPAQLLEQAHLKEPAQGAGLALRIFNQDLQQEGSEDSWHHTPTHHLHQKTVSSNPIMVIVLRIQW